LDRSVTAKFYRIVSGRGSAGPFIEHLRFVNASTPDDRIRMIGDIPFWIDKMDIGSVVASGRFCRKQNTNLPPKALAKAELVPLGIPEIGLTVAWRYDANLSVIAIESSRAGLSLMRFLAYIRAFCDCRGYAPFPVMTDANLAIIRERRIRELSIQLATPRNLHTVAGYQQTMTDGMSALMSDHLGSMLEIRYSLRVGEPDISANRVDRLVRWLRGEHENNRGDIVKVQARIIDEEGESEALDLLDVHLKDHRELPLPDDDPDHNYDIRKAFVASAFTRHENTLLEQFAP
jgi:hypothetical protein